MAGANVVEFTDSNFKSEVLDSQSAVLVDFWAEWCMPCKILGKTIDEIAGEYAGKIKVGKVDIDKHKQAASSYNINAIPTVMIFKGGELKKKFVGLVPKGQIQDALKELA